MRSSRQRSSSSEAAWKPHARSVWQTVLSISLVSCATADFWLCDFILTSHSESGETMRAAGLKAIATVVESTAVLISSKHPSDPKLVNLITNRIKGVITAQKFVLCTYNVERKNLANASKITPGKRAPTVTSLDDEAWVAVQAMVERKTIASVMDDLSAMGATDIIVTKIDNTR